MFLLSDHNVHVPVGYTSLYRVGGKRVKKLFILLLLQSFGVAHLQARFRERMLNRILVPIP